MSPAPPPPPVQSVDVLIVGAGLGGLNAGYRFQTELPKLSYTILERRDEIGGTWSFFKYPGIRSDSDLYTFGFAWEPWFKPSPLADAPSIMEYVRDAAAKHGIDKRVNFGYEATEFDWRSEQQCWTVTTIRNVGGVQEMVMFKARYLVASTGFYNYREPLQSSIPGIERFKGPVVHPQFWPEDLDYKDKKLAVIGSGATAVTIVPETAKQAAKVTMIQRSPTYIKSISMQNPGNDRIRAWLPRLWAGFVLRWKYTILQWAFFSLTRRMPERAKKMFLDEAQDLLPANVPLDPHFIPRYRVWDQRVCVCPDGDFYEALRSGKADVKTGVIRTVKETSVVMDSGEEIDADILVTATGLKLQTLGGAKMTVDSDEPLVIGDRFMWRGAMIQDVPNALVVLGYWNHSWTLGADLATKTFITIIKNAARRGMTSFAPSIAAGEEEKMTIKPLWDMTSTYLKTGNLIHPKASAAAPWTMKDDLWRDLWAWWRNDLYTGMTFGRAPRATDEKKH